MYLKSIEIQGFKSFANKINFQFHQGITAIVGPNGSGKSNVADAVRWVLGEQRTRQLRSTAMQDVIFSGTELRKPLSYAFVAITLDNSDHQLNIDYDEVTVARRLYRSGESEYLINGTACRLKDISELFYDTGIGKEGYSVIGQGQIDLILSGKPEDRRELFDEAAGIVKFKKRKAAAEKKLEDEQNNLVRVKDILGELERQIGPLEKQSEKARLYLKNKEELKTLDVNMFLLENEELNNQIGKVTENLEYTNKDYEECSCKLDSIRKEYDETVSELEELEKSIEAKRKEISDTGIIRGRLESQIELLREQINSIRANEKHLMIRKAGVSGKLDEKEKEEEALNLRKESIDNELRMAMDSRIEVEEQLKNTQKKVEELGSSIDETNSSIMQNLSDRANIKSRAERLNTTREQIEIKKAELTSRLVTARTDEARHLDTINNLQQEFENITKLIASINEQQKIREGQIQNHKNNLTNLDLKLRDLQVKYHQDKTKLEALSNITERYEGYGGSVKMVMEQKDRNPGLIGVVADIIRADKEYEIAIEVALGGNIQNIVTDNEDTAKRMIGLLKKNKGGRATFLPLTSIKNPQEFKTPEVLKEEGVLGLADSIVTTREEYRNVAKAMLGRIVVVDNIDNAVKIARKFDYGVRMVTLEGELIIPGGAISGGAFKNNSNLLGRRREMQELKEAMECALEEIDSTNLLIEEQKAGRNQLREEVEAGKRTLQEEFIKQNTARLNLQAARNRQEESRADYDSIKNESSEIEKQLSDTLKELEDINEKLTLSETMEQKAREATEELSRELEGQQRLEGEILESLKQKEIEYSKVHQRAGFEEANLERVRREKQDYQKELTEILKELENGAEEIKIKEKNITDTEETVTASHSTQSETEKSLSLNISRRDELSARQKRFFTDREKLGETISVLDKEIFRLGEQKSRLTDAVQSKIDYMWNEYEITLRDASILKNPEMNDLSAMKRQVYKIRDDIKKLGDVNVNAIEDYREVSERYSFLKTQHDDLELAKKNLLDIIEQLDTAMRAQFKEKFKAIEKEFDKVFKELFGGGAGNLELMEDQDLLEAGIRIVAQPPGKKLQNMMQLSGGEKSLTAIALLFAIQNLKPSPFCLLDEIEAALDENNVSRYAGYLHKLTRHTQFIVITHRRGTMEKSDRLYGITMMEKGVSTMVSVNLVEEGLK